MARPEQKKKAGASGSADRAPEDGRFGEFKSDSLYRLPSKRQTRVTVDSRFSRMFDDEAFTSRAKVDRYGRKLPKQKGVRGIERLYTLEDGKSGREASKQKAKTEKAAVADDENDFEAFSDEDGDEDGEEDGGVPIADDDEVERELKRLDEGQAPYDPARDGGFEEESSEEETSDESDEEEDEEDVEESGLAARQANDVPDGEVSRRLAVVNLDWDNIRAVDLMVVLKSFATSGGRIDRVTVYPSEFGKERMEREELEGPPKELFAAKSALKTQPHTDDGDGEFAEDEEEDEEDEEDQEDEDEEEEDERIRKSIIQEGTGEDFDSVALRKYQLERLQYFYAVVECSSKNTAKEIYDAVDGTEYLSTANFFDLRFIPDETDFSTDQPRDACTKVPAGYKPNEFSTHALQHSKVKLTWDADDTSRKEAQKRAFSRAEIDENDLKAYLASDTSDDDAADHFAAPEVVDATEATVVTEQEAGKGTKGETQKADPKLSKKEAARQKMRALLGLPAESDIGKSRKDGPVGDMQITFTSGLSGGKSDSVFENEPIDPNETTVERYKRKERERKARRKERMKAARLGEAGDGDATAKAAEEDKDAAEEEDLGFDDPFFTEPATSQAKTKAASKEEKRKKRAAGEAEEARSAEDRAKLEVLMADNDDETGDAARGKVRHFDMSELKKAEKTLRKTKGAKRAKLKPGEKAAIEAKREDDFAMNVADNRFANRMDSAAFAVDPSHPSFADTQGMRELLEAKRKKRSREMAGEDVDMVAEKKKKRGQSGESREEEDLRKLVQRVKGKKR